MGVSCSQSQECWLWTREQRGNMIIEGKYLLFLNPDTELVEPPFGFAISAFESDSRRAVVSVQLLTIAAQLVLDVPVREINIKHTSNRQ